MFAFNLNPLQVIFCLETLPEFKHYKIFNTTANGTKVEEDEVLPFINIISTLLNARLGP